MDAEQLFLKLQVVNAKKDLLLNKDKEKVLELLKGLLLNKKRYGFMSCPCRLASGELENDRDIICPCHYCKADIEEYGSCYCNLYVSGAWNDGVMPNVYVPERRPPEKTIF